MTTHHISLSLSLSLLPLLLFMTLTRRTPVVLYIHFVADANEKNKKVLVVICAHICKSMSSHLIAPDNTTISSIHTHALAPPRTYAHALPHFHICYNPTIYMQYLLQNHPIINHQATTTITRRLHIVFFDP